MVITFDNSEDAVLGYELLRGCTYEDKKLLGEMAECDEVNLVLRNGQYL